MAFRRELTEDLLADVLRCLPPRSLAVSRCVCKAWRDVVDARRLLRADLLPRSVGGIFINYWTFFYPEFFARPTTGPSISGDFEFIPGLSKVIDHCNGIVLCSTSDHDYVVNPATRQWARLPLPPEPDAEMVEKGYRQIKCLVYDPAVAAHCDVFLIHSLHCLDKPWAEPAGQMVTQCEGPASSDGNPLQVYAYSTKSGRWEERCFAPEGRVAEVTIADKKLYWRGALYLLTENDGFVLRISISNEKYTPVPTPIGESWLHGSLGRSEKGVYCAFQYDSHRLRIFLLDESCGQPVWELRHSVDLTTFARKLHAREDHGDLPNGPWILQENNYYRDNELHRDIVEDNFEWNSDEDNVLHPENMVVGHYEGYTDLLGFHPYKKIIFLNAALRRAVAYHWNTSKFQDLGNIYPKDYLEAAGHAAGIETSFIYTPCWMEDLPKNCLSAPIEDQHNGNVLLEKLVE